MPPTPGWRYTAGQAAATIAPSSRVPPKAGLWWCCPLERIKSDSDRPRQEYRKQQFTRLSLGYMQYVQSKPCRADMRQSATEFLREAITVHRDAVMRASPEISAMIDKKFAP